MYEAKFVPMPRSGAVHEGVSQIAIDRFMRHFERVEGTHRGVLITRNGHVIAEKFWRPYRPDQKTLIHSASKAFTATAIGLLVDDCLLNLDDRVISFFPACCPRPLPDGVEDITVRHLLTMSCGHDGNRRPEIVSAPGGDWVKAFLSLPLPHRPGTTFAYNSACSFMLSAIVQKVTGQNMGAFLQERIFQPMQFDTVFWDESPLGICCGGWGIQLRLEDLAKLGQLYLDRGVYQGKRLLSTSWTQQATASQIDNGKDSQTSNKDWISGYGFQIWKCSHDAFRIDGAGGQLSVGVPAQNLCVTMMGNTFHVRELLDLIWQDLLPGCRAVSNELEETVDTYVLAENPNMLKTLTFQFDPSALTLCGMLQDGTCATMRFGRGDWLESAKTLPLGEASFIPFYKQDRSCEPVAGWFEWESPTVLRLFWAYTDTPHCGGARCDFQGTELRMTLNPSDVELMAGKPGKVITGTQF